MPFPPDDHLREKLARAIHQDYLARAVASQDPGGSAEGLVPYDELSEEARESNRRQADDIGVKLEMIGAAAVPLDELARDDLAPVEFRFTRGELQRLSRHEHARWAREKRRVGWRFGPTIDPIARTHPCLVGYARLPEEEKEKDRQVVQRIPSLLRTVGLGIVRYSPAVFDRRSVN
jgi:hypothetical protein